MDDIKKKNWVVFFSMALFVVSFSLNASISVSPSLFELKIPPGKSFTDAIRIVNVTKAKTSINIYLSDFYLNEDGNVKFLESGTHQYSLSNYLRVNPKSLILDPGEEKWVRFTVTIPTTLKGELQGILFFQTVPAKVKDARGRQVLVSARIGTTIYAAGKQTISGTSEISDLFFKMDLNEGSFKYMIIFHNNGNIHVRPKGTLKVLNSKGKEIATSPVNPKNSSVLRNSFRIFEGKFKGDNLEEGIYKIVVELDYGKAVLETEKNIYIVKEGGIETCEIKHSPPQKPEKLSTVTFKAKIKGIEPEKLDVKKMFRLKTLDGNILAAVPAKISLKKKEKSYYTIHVTGEWKGELKSGFTTGEFLFYLHEDKPLTSFFKFKVKE